MNLKVRFAFWFAVSVAAVLSFTFTVIYFQSADFRQDDFFLRLEQKALTTHKLLVEVNEIDSNLLKIIDRNALNALYDEQVIVFDETNNLIYSSTDDEKFPINSTFLNGVRQKGEIKGQLPDKKEYVGLFIQRKDKNYVVIASAMDIYGYRKLQNLAETLTITWLLGLAISVLLAYFYVRQIVGKPLSNLANQVSTIGENDLKARLRVPENQEELTVLAQSFNELLGRLEQAFSSQKQFVQFASHELRTPLANMLSETENMLSQTRSPEIYEKTLRSLREELGRMTDLTNSLLFLTRHENRQLPETTPVVRIDEVLFSTIEEIGTTHPEFKIQMDFSAIPADEKELSLIGNEMLLRTAFRNLIENACQYSDDRTAIIHIDPQQDSLKFRIENIGKTLSGEEAAALFTPFFRGRNSVQKRGFGLGLVIAARILKIHSAEVRYECPTPDTNRFVVSFPNRIN